MLDGFNEGIQSLVDRMGREVTLRSYSSTGPKYDPVLTPTDQTITAAVFDYGADEVDGSIIQSNDKEFIIASTSVVTKQMKLIDRAKEYNIENLEEVEPGNEVLMYIAQGRI